MVLASKAKSLLCCKLSARVRSKSYGVFKRVCVHLSVTHIFCRHVQQADQMASPMGSALHWFCEYVQRCIQKLDPENQVNNAIQFLYSTCTSHLHFSVRVL